MLSISLNLGTVVEIVLNRGFDLFTGEEAQVALNLHHPPTSSKVISNLFHRDAGVQDTR
jgi:hypothetical protein